MRNKLCWILINCRKRLQTCKLDKKLGSFRRLYFIELNDEKESNGKQCGIKSSRNYVFYYNFFLKSYILSLLLKKLFYRTINYLILTQLCLASRLAQSQFDLKLSQIDQILN